MQTTNFHPELGEATPTNVDGYLKPCFHANKIRVWTKLELSGRGVNHERTLVANDLTERAQQWVGFREYVITRAAAAKLNYNFANECLLD